MVFQNWTLKKILGQGAYGKVYLVAQKSGCGMTKHYAMKVINKVDIVEQNMTEGAMVERNMLLEMSHPFILNMHYAFQTEHNLYLILDYVNGGDLFQHLSKKGYMSEKAARYYGAQVVLALEYVHSQNIVYRDLKPENLLIDSDGNIKMADFGISKQINTNQIKKTHTLIGTAQYMPPEAFSNSEGYGQAFDIWSLGCCLYEIVVGEPPYGLAQSSIGDMQQVLRDEEIQMRDFFSKEFRSLLEGLLDYNPQRRLTIAQIKTHPFFAKVDWDKVLAKNNGKPPIKPNTANNNTRINIKDRNLLALDADPEAQSRSNSKQCT